MTSSPLAKLQADIISLEADRFFVPASTAAAACHELHLTRCCGGDADPRGP